MTNYTMSRGGPVVAVMRRIGFCLCLAVLVLQPTIGRSAVDGPTARAFIEGLADKAITALTPPDIPQAEREERARELLRENFAVETIGQFVLGRHWKAATPEEREEYIRLFEELIVTTYVDRFKTSPAATFGWIPRSSGRGPPPSTSAGGSATMAGGRRSSTSTSRISA